jgi:hypothetical protein
MARIPTSRFRATIEPMTQPPNHRPIADIVADIAAAALLIQTLNAELSIVTAHEEKMRERDEKRKWRYKRYRARLKKRSDPRKNSVVEKKNNGTLWRGITWQDMPGKDNEEQKFNLALFKRRDFPQLKSCYSLQGEALKSEIARIIQVNRDRSLKAMV